MEMGFPFGEKCIQKVWLDAFPGTQSFVLCQSHMKFVEDCRMLEPGVYARVYLV